MRTSIYRIVRCAADTASTAERRTILRQPWLCLGRPAIDAVVQYNNFWEKTLRDTTVVENFYDGRLADSGAMTERDAMLSDDSAWRSKLAAMDAKWAELDVQRATENAERLASVENVQQELSRGLGDLAMARHQIIGQ